MLKAAKWRNEKNIIEAAFKLQFHATQVGHVGADALVVSVVPSDVGRPTLRLEKATIRNGCCRWKKFVFETVKFVQDPRSGVINQKIYNFIVSSGSPKGGDVGEVLIDFANYSEAIKPAYVSLPLRNSNSKAVLHVSIQRLLEDLKEREAGNEEDKKADFKDNSLGIKRNTNEIIGNSPVEGMQHKYCTSNDAGIDCVSRASSGSDITMSSSDCSSGFDTLQVPLPRNNHLTSSNLEDERSRWAWAAGPDQDPSADNSSTTSQGTAPSEKSNQCSDNEIDKLKAELQVLPRQVDIPELELQTLCKQIVKESKRGQDLLKEIYSLKQDNNALMEENDKLKAFQKCLDNEKVERQMQGEGGDLHALVEEIRQELHYEKDMNVNLSLQLQKTQEANSELILAVQDLEEMLDKNNRNISCISGNSHANTEEQQTIFKCERDENEEQIALEELAKKHKDAADTQQLEQRILGLNNEIEFYRRDKDAIEMQMEKLVLDYELLKQENHELSCKLEQSQLQEPLKMQYECYSCLNVHELEMQISNLQDELMKQSKEKLQSLATISELETYIKSLEDEFDKQEEGFKADLEAVTRAKDEHEQRATRAEEALRKTRWGNAYTAEKLQEEFEKLSLQMASSFEANEKIAMKALMEANELHAHKSHLEEMLKDANEETCTLRDHSEAKVLDLSSQVDLKTDQIEQLKSEIENISMQLEAQKKNKEEICEAFSQEILILKAEIEKLNTECNILSKETENNKKLRAELDDLKRSTDEAEILIQRGSKERKELERTVSVLKGDAEKLIEEINIISDVSDEKNRQIQLLQTELNAEKSERSSVQLSIHDGELEKERFQHQVIQLKTELKKKEDEVINLEKKFAESNGHAAILDGTKASARVYKSAHTTLSAKEVAGLRERIRSLEGQIKSKESALLTTTNSFLLKESDLQKKIEELESCLQLGWRNASIQENVEDPVDLNISGHSNVNIAEILSQVESLKEKNKLMEGELKEMQERYSEISLKFAEVEGERQTLVMTLRNLKNARKG